METRRRKIFKFFVFSESRQRLQEMYLKRPSVMIGRRPDLVGSCSGAGGLRSPHNRIPPTSPPQGMRSPRQVGETRVRVFDVVGALA